MSQDPNAPSMTPEQLEESAERLKVPFEPKVPAPSPSEKFETIGLAPADDLEVKPVKPIVTDDPKDVIQRLREELVKERAAKLQAHELVELMAADRDGFKSLAESAEGALNSVKKRVGEVCSERDRLVNKLKAVQEQVDAQKAEKLVAMIDERQKLRTDIGHKDKQIADLVRQLGAAQAQAEASRTLARQADQRAQGFEASLEAMQVARGKAQRDAGEANGILLEIRSTLAVLGVDMDKTPPMLYPEAIKSLYGTWSRKAQALETQVESLLAKVAAPAPARKG